MASILSPSRFRGRQSKRMQNDLDPAARTTRPGLFDNLRDDLFAASLEFVGTICFLMLAFGGIQAVSEEGKSGEASNIERVMYISLSMGFSLLVSAWLFFRVTGGLFNPNVSLALLLTGIIGPVRFVLYCVAQMIGGIAAAGLVLALTPNSLQSNTFLAPNINPAQAVFIEMFITAILCIAVLMLAAEKHVATPFAPVGIGLTLFACHLFAVNYTGAGMNTARSFGPAVVTGFPFGTQWVYWVGPGLGSLVAAAFYSILKHFQYYRLNPGQDTMDHRNSPKDPISSVINRTKSRSSATNDLSPVREKRNGSRDQATNGEMSSSGAGTRLNDSPV